MSTNAITTTTSTQGSQVPSPKKVAQKVAPAEGEKEKKPRKPSLKEKHSRFLVSNYTLIQFLSSKGLLTDEAVESAYSEIKLMAPVEDQEAFYESYLSESKTTKKAMTKFVKDRNKPPKAPKKTRAKKADGETAPKKSRAKKITTVANDTEVDVVAQATANDEVASDLVNELTAAATAVDTEAVMVAPPATPETQAIEVAEAPGAPKKEPKAKKEVVKKEPKAKKEVAKKEPKAKKEVAEKKPKATKKSKKEETPIVAAPVVVEEATAPVVVEEAKEEEEEDEEIHTQEIEIAGKSYLIDGDNNIYSVDTHDEIGTYDATTNTISATL